jgi:alpha-D-ribose 1-methylphosphonate 5-triphosphate synthase subunit PhnI
MRPIRLIEHVELLVNFQGEEDSLWYVGEILLTEVDAFIPKTVKTDNLDQSSLLQIAVGYGVVFGRCETKAIAMSILDCTLDMPGDAPCHNAEFVLLCSDTIEMNGFVAHLKLPHYVTFQSKMDRVRESLKNGNC